MNIFFQQLRKFSTFIYILIALFIGAVIFNFNFRWEGVSIILRIYLFIFAFYIIYTFSMMDIDGLKAKYHDMYGRKGIFILFSQARVFPFLFIYFTIIILTFINYIGSPDWPAEPILNILNGRYSNTLIYSLILLLILNMKKSPRVTVPMFLIFAVLYFILYKVVYFYSPAGILTTLLKILNFIIVIFILLFEFFYDRSNLLKISIHTVSIALALHFIVVGCLYSINRYSKPASYGEVRSSTFLLKMGFSFPLVKLRNAIIKHSKFQLIHHLIYYSRKYNREIDFSIEEWEDLMFSGTVQRTDLISMYLLDKIKSVSYKSLIAFAEMNSRTSGEELINAGRFIKYSSKYFEEFMDDFFARYKRHNFHFKIWVLKVIGDAEVVKSIPFLIDKLTDLNLSISEEAFRSIAKITKMDAAKKYGIKINSPAVVRAYKEYYQMLRKDD